MPVDSSTIAPFIREFVVQQAIIALATTARDGMPNVAPMFWKVWYDETKLLVLDNFMRATKANVLATGRASVSVWDAASGTAYQLKGAAKDVTEGPYFEAGASHMAVQKPGQRPKGVVVLHVTSVYTQQPGIHAGNLVNAQGEVWA
ncbi:MAG: Pyridoxamine 5'-phosphate oxidase [bacterium ADurb.Bin429]|nr:MAG: Pyridoxamine 5'-phosphate oxidase [bacterium ADurb.Bin429]